MKQIVFVVSILALLFTNTGCYGQSAKKEITQEVKSSKVTVYYFHFTHRCATCMAVEENSRKAFQALYPDKIKDGTYTFSVINLDEAVNKKLADKLGVGGQTLLVVCGDKKMDLTSAGFMNANDIDKLKKEIEAAVTKIVL